MDRMSTLLTLLLIGTSAVLSIPLVILVTEILAALFGEKSERLTELQGNALRRAVIIPAHNEGAGVVPTIGDVRPQLGIGDRLILVADNCTDDTPAIAAKEGCEVLIRNDLSRVGKGYALAWAIDHLRSDPPDFVVFIDADCRIKPKSIDSLARTCRQVNRPLQAYYSMTQAANSAVDHSWAEFAWILKNWVRPLGLNNLNCPVQLMGTGMIFPWRIIDKAPLSSGHLVEDMKLGLDLAAEGHAPRFFPSIMVSSEFPQTETGTVSQRQRWIQGHVGMIGAIPKLVMTAITSRNLELLVLLADLAIPPLSLLGLLIVVSLVLTILATTLGASSVPLVVATANFALFAATILVAWYKFARDVIPPVKFLMLGPTLIKKLALYCQMALGRTTSHWVRTDRAKRTRIEP
jgi:cellulose synthase/poly-beta-1,6-N-acetylglucosamine synthase-like glycosyltransferase